MFGWQTKFGQQTFWLANLASFLYACMPVWRVGLVIFKKKSYWASNQIKINNTYVVFTKPNVLAYFNVKKIRKLIWMCTIQIQVPKDKEYYYILLKFGGINHFEWDILINWTKIKMLVYIIVFLPIFTIWLENFKSNLFIILQVKKEQFYVISKKQFCHLSINSSLSFLIKK